MAAVQRGSNTEEVNLELLWRETEDIDGGTAPRIAQVCAVLVLPICSQDLPRHESNMMLRQSRHQSMTMQSGCVLGDTRRVSSELARCG